MKILVYRQRIVIFVMAGLIVAAVAIVIWLQPTNAAFWVGGAIFGISGVFAALSFGLARNRKREIFEPRSELSDSEIYDQFYSGSDIPLQLVSELWREAARVFGVPPGKLRPTDRFGHELGAYWITSEELDTLAEIARGRAMKKNGSINLENVQTLDEYIRRLASMEQ